MSEEGEKARVLMPALDAVASRVADATENTNDAARLLHLRLDAIGQLTGIIRTSPARPNCLPSMPRSKPRGRASKALASASSPPK